MALLLLLQTLSRSTTHLVLHKRAARVPAIFISIFRDANNIFTKPQMFSSAGSGFSATLAQESSAFCLSVCLSLHVKSLLFATPRFHMFLPRRFRAVSLVLLLAAFPVCALSRHVLLDQVNKTLLFYARTLSLEPSLRRYAASTTLMVDGASYGFSFPPGSRPPINTRSVPQCFPLCYRRYPPASW